MIRKEKAAADCKSATVLNSPKSTDSLDLKDLALKDLARKVHVTTFRDGVGSDGKAHHLIDSERAISYQDLLSELASLKAFPSKELCDRVSFAKYRGEWRNNANVVCNDLLVGDCDTDVTLEDIHAALEGYEHVVIGSYNHLQDGKTEKYRVLLLLDRPCTPAEYKATHDEFRKLLEVDTGAERAKDACRFSYIGRRPVFEGFFERREGRLFPVFQAPEKAPTQPIAIGHGTVSDDELEAGAEKIREALPGEGQHDYILCVSGCLRAEGMSEDATIAILTRALADTRHGDDLARLVKDDYSENRAQKTGRGAFEEYGTWTDVARALGLRKQEDALGESFDRRHAEMQKLGVRSSSELRAAKENIGRVQEARRTLGVAVKAVDRELKTPGLCDLAYELDNGDPSTDPYAWPKGCFRYDTATQKIRAVNPPTTLDAETPRGLSDHDVTEIRAHLESSKGWKVSRELAWDAIGAIAHANAYSSIVEYLDGLAHVDPSYLDNLATELFGADTPVENLALKNLLVGAVARGRNPGTKHDTMLVLQGPQGYLKSTFCTSLGRAWYLEQMPADLGNKDASLAIATSWIVEFAELDAMRKSDVNTVKAFLSRTKDQFRAPYAKAMQESPRQCVFIGTCNRDDFLVDETGNRRFHVVRVKKKIAPLTSDDVAMIWAAADAAYKVGHRHWFDDEHESEMEAIRKEYEDEEAWTDQIADYLRGVSETTVTKVWEGSGLAPIVTVSPKRYKAIERKDEMRIAKVLRRLGYAKRKNSTGRSVWRKDEPLADRKAA